MYRREKQSKQEYHTTSKVYHNMPSFSSTLLDEIYRSIDGNVESTEHSISVYKGKPTKTTSSRKTSFVEKWMEKEVSENVTRDNDVLFFGSTCSSSDSSSSDNADFFGSQKESSKVSGLLTRPKPVSTGKHGLFDDYQSAQQKSNGDDVIKSKSKALKIYSHLKKIKQPISPGMKLTNFINTLFSTKKARNVEKKPSSACSFSRSCLNKSSPKSREKIRERKVKFHPVTVIMDEDSSRKKCDYNDDYMKKPPLPPNAVKELKQNMREKNRRIEEAVQKVLEGYNSQRKDEKVARKVIGGGYTCQGKEDSSMFRTKCDEDEDDEYDVMSDSSSDLFELDHMVSFYNNNKFDKELPVYETTQFDTNRAMFRGLIR